MAPAKWEIWFVNMPFEEGTGSKVRPALVIDPQQGFAIVGKMTSHPPRQHYPYEYQMIDWQGAGLTRQTTLRLSKLVRLENSRFLRKLGNAQPVDQVNIRYILTHIMK